MLYDWHSVFLTYFSVREIPVEQYNIKDVKN